MATKTKSVGVGLAISLTEMHRYFYGKAHRGSQPRLPPYILSAMQVRNVSIRDRTGKARPRPITFEWSGCSHIEVRVVNIYKIPVTPKTKK
jgi:hypothetical protein